MIKKAYVEITNACNRSCPFCPGTGRPRRFMSGEEFTLVLDRLRGKVQYLYLHVMGEPLLHPLLGRFLQMAGEAGFPVNVTTNGTLLGGVSGILLDAPALRQVSVSLHSLVEGEEGLRCLNEILAFAKDAQARGRPLVSLRLWNEGAGERNPANGWILQRLERAYGQEALYEAGAGDNRGVRLASGIYLNLASLFIWPDLALPELGERGFCMGLRDQLGILCDGTVVPCCLDGQGAMPLGNIFTQNIDEILSSPRATGIVNGFSRRVAVEELCRKCGYRQRFD